MPESIDWAWFLASAIAINLAPGPDLLFIVSRTLRHGRRVGVAASMGVCAGALVHVLAAAAGVSALLAASDRAFTVMRWVGGAYLAWLGVGALRATQRDRAVQPAQFAGDADAWETFRAGVMVDVLNPKVSLFFLAFLPQFAGPGTLAPHWQILILGLVVLAIALVLEILLVTALTRARRHAVRPGVARGLEALSGLALIGLAVQLGRG